MKKKASRKAVARKPQEQEFRRKAAKERRDERAIARMQHQAERPPAVMHHGRDALPRPGRPATIGMIFPDIGAAFLLLDFLSLGAPRYPRTTQESLEEDRRALEGDRRAIEGDGTRMLGLPAPSKLIEHK